MRRLLFLPLLLAATLVRAGEAPASPAPPATPLPPAAAFRDYRPADLCLDIAASFGRQDAGIIERHFDMDGFMQRALPAGLDREVAAALSAGLRTRLLQALAEQVRSEALDWSSRLQDEGRPEQRCTLGAIAGDGMMIFDFYVQRRGDALVITDMRNHGMARRSSDLMYRLFTSILPLDTVSAWSPASTAERLAALGSSERLARISAFIKAVDGDDRAEMIARYEALPEDARREPVLLIRLIHGVRSDDVLYQRYLARLAALVGDDPEFSFMLFDHYLEVGDKARLLRARQHVSERASALLPVLLLGVLAEREAGKAADLRRSVARLLEANDGYEPVYWLIAEDAVRRGDFETGVTALKVLQQRFGHDFREGAADEEDYLRALRGSVPFRHWMAQQPVADAAARP